MAENELLTKQEEGRRIIVMVWVLVAASVAAGALTIGLVGWTLLSMREERSLLINQESQLVKTSLEVNRLVSFARSAIESLLQDRPTQPKNATAIQSLQEYIHKQVNATPDPQLREILVELGTSGANLVDLWNRVTSWRTQFNQVLLDIDQQRSLGKVRGLLHNVAGSVALIEGQRRLQEAMKFRRWRATQGRQASELAKEILLGQANQEIQDLRALQIELSEVARLAEVLAGEDSLDNLADIKDNQLKPSLDRLSHIINNLASDKLTSQKFGPETIEALNVALFGQGYVMNEAHQSVSPGQGGLFSLRHNFLRLRQERQQLQIEFQDIASRINLFHTNLAKLTQEYTTTLAHDMENKLTQSWYNLVIIGALCFAGFLILNWMISGAIRRQVEALKEAVTEAETSHQTTQRLLKEQHKATEAFERLSQQNRLILDSAGEGIYGLDSDGTTTFINHAAASMTGWEAEDLLGKQEHSLIHHTRPNGESYVREECPVFKTCKDGVFKHVDDEVFWRKDGTSFPVEYTSTPIWEEGKLVGAVVTFQDRTERKIAEEKMQEARMAAEKANRAKSDFLASMSHELRTPLNGILGYAQILTRDKTLTESQKTSVEVMQRSGEHLLNLINDILDLSKIEARKLEIKVGVFHLGKFLEDIAHMMSVRAEQKGITFSYTPSSAMPGNVKGDDIRLRQVLLNLLGNAIKFTKQGTVALTVDYNNASSEENMIQFKVIDSGIGIKADKLGEIFKPFHQVSDRYQQAEGTGLGLAICKQLVTLMGGDLQVTSIPEQGSSFWFTIPLPIAEDVELPPPTPFGTIVRLQGEPKRILIADDKWQNRMVVMNLLSPLGFEMIEATDGQEALNKAAQSHPHAIIMDLLMPGMDGFEATRQLRKSPEFQDIPIIASSASVFDFNQQDAIKAGCTDFLPKPVQAEKLFEKLRQHMSIEWVYEEEPSPSVPSKEDGRPLVPPPAEFVLHLYNLTQKGRIVALRKEIAKIEDMGEQYLPFANELRRLAKGFDMEFISQFLQPYLEPHA